MNEMAIRLITMLLRAYKLTIYIFIVTVHISHTNQITECYIVIELFLFAGSYIGVYTPLAESLKLRVCLNSLL